LDQVVSKLDTFKQPDSPQPSGVLAAEESVLSQDASNSGKSSKSQGKPVVKGRSTSLDDTRSYSRGRSDTTTTSRRSVDLPASLERHLAEAQAAAGMSRYSHNSGSLPVLQPERPLQFVPSYPGQAGSPAAAAAAAAAGALLGENSFQGGLTRWQRAGLAASMAPAAPAPLPVGLSASGPVPTVNSNYSPTVSSSNMNLSSSQSFGAPMSSMLAYSAAGGVGGRSRGRSRGSDDVDDNDDVAAVGEDDDTGECGDSSGHGGRGGHREREIASAAAAAAAAISPGQPAYVWIDWIALNQHTYMCSAPSVADLELVRRAVLSCPFGLCLVVDPGLRVLTRVWCMFETWIAGYYGAALRVQLALPADMPVADMMRLESTLAVLDVAKLDCSRAEDKAAILTEIKSTVGAKRMHKSLMDSVLRAARTGLRCDGNMGSMGMYCALLFKSGEFCRLQQVFHNIPELEDDEKMLQEIRDIFAVYDTDGSGQLDESEFVAGLCNVGFAEEEATQIYNEVDVDGEGGVSAVEFEAWWVQSQRQQAMRSRKAVAMTPESLAANLGKMGALMERSEQRELARFFGEAQADVESGRLRVASGLSCAQPLKGNWAALVDSVAWKLHNKKYRNVAQTMYELLLWNSDSLDINPTSLITPDRLMASEHDMQEGLAIYLEMFANMLHWQPERQQTEAFFRKCVNDIRANIAMGLARGRLKPPRLCANNPLGAKYDFQKYEIVRSMIKLKYGKGQPIQRNLIVEAEMSLGAWMATQRHDKEKIKRIAVSGAVNEMAAAYLTHSSPDVMGPIPATSSPSKGSGAAAPQGGPLSAPPALGTQLSPRPPPGPPGPAVPQRRGMSISMSGLPSASTPQSPPPRTTITGGMSGPSAATLIPEASGGSDSMVGPGALAGAMAGLGFGRRAAGLIKMKLNLGSSKVPSLPDIRAHSSMF